MHDSGGSIVLWVDVVHVNNVTRAKEKKKNVVVTAMKTYKGRCVSDWSK